MAFKCAVCLDLYEDESGKAVGGATKDSDTCASCGYNNSMNLTNTE
jgi:rubredoxin